MLHVLTGPFSSFYNTVAVHDKQVTGFYFLASNSIPFTPRHNDKHLSKLRLFDSVAPFEYSYLLTHLLIEQCD